MSYQDIRVEARGSAAWLTLNRPSELNTLSQRLMDEVGSALDAAEHDELVRCVIITGAGRAFCAGADLKFVNDFPAERQAEATATFLNQADALMSRIEAFPKPVIAAVNGLAVGGGMEIILSCDLVIAAESARLGDGHTNFGMLPGAGASVRLPRKIGPSRAKYLFFTGDLVEAGDPLLAELITQVVPDADLEAAVARLAEKIAAKSPLGLSIIKALSGEAFNITQYEALAQEQAVNRAYVDSHDRNEGLAAFNARRKPVFLGR